MEKKVVYAIVAIVVAVIVVTAVLLVTLAPPPAKYKIELWYNNDGHYGDTEDELATVLQDSIQACGKIEVTLRSDTWAVYRQNWANGLMDVFLLGWYPDYFDSDNYVSPFLSTSGAESLGSFYSDAQMDQWITDEQTNLAVRAARFTSIQDKLAADVPYLPLFSGNAHVAYVSGITNVVLHPVSFKWFIMDKPGATELIGSTSDKIISLDPASAYDYFSIEVINQVFDTLLVYEPETATLMPGLATEVPTLANGGISADGMTYTYNLKTGVTFHDGTPLNSSVVKRAIDRAIRLDLPGSAAFLLYDVGALERDPMTGNTVAGTIETPDATKVVFNLARPVAFFNDLMAFSLSAPVPWDYDQTGEQPSTVGNVIGTGPYRLTTHVENQLVVLDRYAGYHSPNLYQSLGIASIPVEDRITLNIRLTATALKQDIETKAVDVVYRTLTPTDLIDLQGRASSLGITVDVGTSPFIRYLVFNVDRVTDVEARQAIAYSVDRARIDTTVFEGLVEPLYSMIPSNMPYYGSVFLDSYGAQPNCASANTLLQALGYSIQLPRIWIAKDA